LGAFFLLEFELRNLVENYPFAARFIIGCALLSLGVVIYWPGLSGGFFFDDSVNILEPAGIQLKSISQESLLNVWESGVGGPLRRPISMLTFAANYYLSGFAPFWFKLTNLLIHCANGVLVYFLGLLLVRAVNPSMERLVRARLVAVVVAALWAFNPIQLTSVLYVVQRMTSLSSMFVLMALILHIWARQRRGWSWANVVCYVAAWGLFLPLAVLSKETGVLYLLYVATYETFLHRNFAGGFDRFAKLYLVLLGLAGLGLLLYLGLGSGPGLLGGYKDRNFTLSERVLSEFRIIWAYVGLILTPSLPNFGLYHDDFVVSTGIFKPMETAFAILGLVFVLVFAWLVRSRVPIVAFGIFWFFAGHSLESTIFPLELMHEHRNYLPSFGIMIVIGTALMSQRMAEPKFRLLTSVGVLALFFYFALITHLRADLYGDDFRRTQIEADYRSESVRSQYEAGALRVNMYNQHRAPVVAGFADKYFKRVNVLDPTYKLGLIGMLQLDCLYDKSARVEVFEELKSRLKESKWIPFDRAVMHGIAEMANEGTICLTREQVENLFEIALENKYTSPDDRSVIRSDYVLYLWLGQKDYTKARSVLTKAVAENEDDVLNRINLLQLSRLQGDKQGVLTLLSDLRGRKLSRQDRALVQDVIDELAAQGVVTNNL
jgi:protein O-mannosyl-transferase